VFDWK